MTLRNAAQVLVGYGHWMAEGIEEDSVGGFVAYSGKGEQAMTQLGGGCGGEAIQRAGKFGIEHGKKGFERRCLAGNETGGADEVPELLDGDGAEAFRSERSGGTQVGK